ncbi:MAG: malate/lactate/ureidoglycolate dehydrogenase [Pseudomonadota bacterium]
MSNVILPYKGVTAVLSRIFVAAGGSEEEAGAIAEGLVGANLAGHDSHGVVRTPRYVEAAQNGMWNFGVEIETTVDGGAFALIDGGAGYGHWVGAQAVREGISRAEEHGVSVIGLRNAGHIGRIGGWAEMALAAGQVSLHFVNVSRGPLVAPFGGAGRRISTAPVSIGVPNPDGDDFVLDFATSRIAEGKALVALKAKREVKHGDLVDGVGKPTGDPSVLYGPSATSLSPNPREGDGALVAMGDHKGSGLALACELLAGAITGNGPNKPGQGVFNGMLSVYVDPARIDDGYGWGPMVTEYIDWVKSCPPADPDAPVMIPGDPERKARADRMTNGMPLDPQSWDDILKSGEKVGLDRAELEALVG